MIYNYLYLCRKFLRFLHFLHRILKVGEFATNSGVFTKNSVVFDERIVVLDQPLSVPQSIFVTNLPKHLEFSKIGVIFTPSSNSKY